MQFLTHDAHVAAFGSDDADGLISLVIGQDPVQKRCNHAFMNLLPAITGHCGPIWAVCIVSFQYENGDFSGVAVDESQQLLNNVLQTHEQMLQPQPLRQARGV